MKSDERPQDYIFTRHLLCSYPKDAYNGSLSRYFVFRRLCDGEKSDVSTMYLYCDLFFDRPVLRIAPVSNQIKKHSI